MYVRKIKQSVAHVYIMRRNQSNNLDFVYTQSSSCFWQSTNVQPSVYVNFKFDAIWTAIVLVLTVQ